MDEMELEKALLKAFCTAIQVVGLAKFKTTTMFGSNDGRKRAAAARWRKRN